MILLNFIFIKSLINREQYTKNTIINKRKSLKQFTPQAYVNHYCNDVNKNISKINSIQLLNFLKSLLKIPQ